MVYCGISENGALILCGNSGACPIVAIQEVE
jgi:hypothetical protein